MKKLSMLFLLICLFIVSNQILLFSQSVAVSPNSVFQGGTTKCTWLGFNGPFSVRLYKGNTFAYIRTQQYGNDDEDVQMIGNFDEIRNDYNVQIWNYANPPVKLGQSNYFSVTKPTPPSLNWPPDYGIYNKLNNSSITLSWNGVSGAQDYHLNLFKSDNSSNPIFYDWMGSGSITSKSINISNLSNDVYIWQVKVKVNGYESEYCTSRQFIADQPPTSPTLSSPDNQLCFKNGVSQTFSWSSNEDIARYELKIVKGTDIWGTNLRGVVYQNNENVTMTYGAGDYIWSVMAIKPTPNGYNPTTYENTIGWGGLSNPRTFKVAPPTPTGLALTYQTGGFNISWNNVSGTGNYPQYKIFWGTSDNVDESSQLISEDMSPSFHNDRVLGQTYYYKIQSCYNGCCSDLSSPAVSKKYELPLLSHPVLISPINNAIVSSNILTWNTVAEATGYEICIDDKTPFISINSGSISNHTSNVEYGNHNWKMRTRNSGGQFGDWSNKEYFSYQTLLLIETLVKFYMNDGSAVQVYNINDIDKMAIKKINNDFSMTVYYKKDSSSAYQTSVIDTMKFVTNGNNQKIFNIYISGNTKSYLVSDLDSLIFKQYEVNSETVTIGTQVWTKRNLDVAYYRNGAAIRHAVSDADWVDAGSKKEGAWCYYNNDPANGAIYGKLYNWYAVKDSRDLAPIGYHVPSDAEWTILTNYLGGENIAGGKLKETGFTHWLSPNQGATNTSGFTALPGGYRYDGGNFFGLSYYGNWWSATEYNEASAWISYLYFSYPYIYRSSYSKVLGFSVRCLRD